MTSRTFRCYRCVDALMVKNGRTMSGKQRYLCKKCKSTRVEKYIYNAYKADINKQIILLTREGLGIRSTARVLGISPTTLLKRIISIANGIVRPVISKGKVYEVDELRTFIGSKKRLVWIVYALERENRKIAGFYVGTRTNKTLKVVLETLRLSDAERIYTDGLRNYKYLIGKKVHKVIRFGTNHIERLNLNLRIHLKRLNRRTICYSKSLVLLNAVLKIYFWG